MWNLWGENKGEPRADKVGADRWNELRSRIEAMEAKIAELTEQTAPLADLPVQWATTTTQLRRLVGHITKTAALDAHRPPDQPPPPTPRPLTQDEVIHRMNNGGAA